jgi:hypothetical protein
MIIKADIVLSECPSEGEYYKTLALLLGKISGMCKKYDKLLDDGASLLRDIDLLKEENETLREAYGKMDAAFISSMELLNKYGAPDSEHSPLFSETRRLFNEAQAVRAKVDNLMREEQ